MHNHRPVYLWENPGIVHVLFDVFFIFFKKKQLDISKSINHFSCINQLLSITHDIYELFEDSKEVRGAFLDTSNNIDKVYDIGFNVRIKRKHKINLLTFFLTDIKELYPISIRLNELQYMLECHKVQCLDFFCFQYK